MPGLTKSPKTKFVEKFLEVFKEFDAVYFDQSITLDSLLEISDYDAEYQTLTFDMRNYSYDDFVKIACLVPIFYEEVEPLVHIYLINWFEQSVMFSLMI